MPPTTVTRRYTCRACGSPSLTPVLDLGEMAIAGAFAEPDGRQPAQRTVPLELVRCDPHRDENACGLVQLRHTVPAAILYDSYWYRSGINQTMTDNLHGIARDAETLVELRSDDLVVDIGCNDGTLLDGYTIPAVRTLGFDPSDVARYAVEKGYDVISDFFSARSFNAHANGPAKVVTSIAMFYDLDDPHSFVADVAEILDDAGVWVMELHYLPSMLAANSFDAIVHEHLCYYSLAVIERILAEHGLEVADAELNAINGGSIRLFIGHRGALKRAGGKERVQNLRLSEFELALDSPAPYEQFRENVEKVRSVLVAYLRQIREEGKTVHAYGASTKGNTILQYAGIDRSLVQYAADRNPDKWGSETIRTGIPIISEEQSRAMRPDYYLVLPWHFIDEFTRRERDYLAAGGQFIVPLPEVGMIGNPTVLKAAA